MKRKTKQEREREEKAALRQRLWDMALGACGAYTGTMDDMEELNCTPYSSLEHFGAFLAAVKRAFERSDEGYRNSHLFESHCWRHWNDFDNLTNHLYRGGVRA